MKADAVALDGPLRPRLEFAKSYRAAEAALSCGRFQRRGKPGPTNGGSGPALHQEATRLAGLCLTHLQIKETGLRIRLRSEAIAEAFPNLFLGVLCDEDRYPTKPTKRRRWTDTLFPIVTDKLIDLLATLLPGRRIEGDLGLRGHEEVAALACALTALCMARECLVAVGSMDDGFIVLPPLYHWGRPREGSRPWADSELELTMERARSRFPRVEQWEPRECAVVRAAGSGPVLVPAPGDRVSDPIAPLPGGGPDEPSNRLTRDGATVQTQASG